ncbi:cytochrome c peroxidase [Ferrimonas gelatinilytica]|uniref:Cytochrome c peroxidase n=1 Tax=Ferrimonas gelatinilytica TaxID=1255257 RepID=A0ABP9RU75_9GAMM
MLLTLPLLAQAAPPLTQQGVNSQMTAADPRWIALGRQLFLDRRLSVNGTLSCANCHVPAMGFTHHQMETAVGVAGRAGRRNAPTLLNVGRLPALFWDGREGDLEAQIWGPLLDPSEMANPSRQAVVDRLAALPDYQVRFEVAFAGPVTAQRLGQALAAYQRSLVAMDSPWQRWLSGEVEALSDEARQGLVLFGGKAGCYACHPLQSADGLMTDHHYHRTGAGAPQRDRRPVLLPDGSQTQLGTLVNVGGAARPDLGRAEVTGEPTDQGKFRTPGLRNVALTPPYMHDGSLPTLAAVVAFYNAGGGPVADKSPRVMPLHLSAEEQRQLVAFLQALTGREAQRWVQQAEATPVGNPGD